MNGTTFTDTVSGATIQIDDGTVLTLTNATINGGTIDDGTAGGTGTPALFGSIDVTGSSKISNAFLNNGGGDDCARRRADAQQRHCYGDDL